MSNGKKRRRPHGGKGKWQIRLALRARDGRACCFCGVVLRLKDSTREHVVRACRTPCDPRKAKEGKPLGTLKLERGVISPPWRTGDWQEGGGPTRSVRWRYELGEDKQLGLLVLLEASADASELLVFPAVPEQGTSLRGQRVQTYGSAQKPVAELFAQRVRR